MGCINSITKCSFPEQGNFYGKEVLVCFHYNTKDSIKGIVVRDDTEEPGIMIIKLEDDRYVLSTECQFTFNVLHLNDSN